ncbi:hypothetical protein AAFF_G00219460 [Aldrovandia affinis]|uniref:Uncharacterized protein n=1 Tax=Aldrovandia affinis TaxID=143900 RepID=A0AAD7RFX9_9TELE|nr:hypothetical protein AAFF_G00219460 [Aldrovandia affinis]
MHTDGSMFSFRASLAGSSRDKPLRSGSSIPNVAPCTRATVQGVYNVPICVCRCYVSAAPDGTQTRATLKHTDGETGTEESLIIKRITRQTIRPAGGRKLIPSR